MSHLIARLKMFMSENSVGPLIFISSIFLVTLIVVLITVKYAKANKRRSHRHHHHRPRDESKEQISQTDNGQIKTRRRKRRSAHPEMPRGPTLAETGGLPPLRGEDTPPNGL